MYKRSFKDYFGRNRNVLYIILGIVLVSVFTLTIVYAALSVTLNITGSAEVVASNWDIHLDNVQLNSNSVTTTVPSITSSTTATFSTTLTTPGDFYEFTIDVVNDGSIDAMIDGITKTPTLTETQAKYLKYEVEYQNGEAINTKQLVSANSFVRLKVRVEFRKDITASDLPTTSETLNLSFTVNYVQSDGTASSVTDNGVKLIKVVSGDGTKTSDEICIGEECFYVISSIDDTVTMLAKYNLYVGGEYNSGWTEYGDEATGKQDSSMLGYVSGQSIRKGTLVFSSTTYWNDGSALKSEYGVEYPAYVYDSNSTLYNYVENYKTYLESQGVAVDEARLISFDELLALGCVYKDVSAHQCDNAPSWVTSTSYWTGTAKTNASLKNVSANSLTVNNESYSRNMISGVRPVIVIAKSNF